MVASQALSKKAFIWYLAGGVLYFSAMQQKAKFISLEGGEGMGKSTALKFMCQEFDRRGVDYVVTREPGGTPLAEDIRQTLLSECDEAMMPETEALLMFAARAQNVAQVIKPALAKGQWVLCDRFVDASLAYQGGGRQLGLPKMDALADWVLGDFRPDLTILLDAPVEVGLKRIQRRASKDRIEQEQVEFFQRVRKVYLQLVEREPARFRVVDASQSIQQVQQSIHHALSEL